VNERHHRRRGSLIPDWCIQKVKVVEVLFILCSLFIICKMKKQVKTTSRKQDFILSLGY